MSDRRLVVFSDDWGRHPSSAQHLVRHLVARWKVDWVNTIGTRRPSFNVADLKRGLEKLIAWTRLQVPGAALPTGLTVHAPIHWPGFSSKFERGLNARIFDRALRPLVERADAVVTTASIVADLAARTSNANWVYYCVDDLSEWPGLDAAALRAMELDLLPHMKRCVAVSDTLRARLKSLGRESDLLTHGIDLEHWRAVAARAPRARREKPVCVFFGVSDRRLDPRIVLALADVAELRMIGPTRDVDPLLASSTRISFLPAVPYADLPSVVLEADVLVMPYADLPVTRAMQPLKLKEYLATRLPVIATPLPANLEWHDALDLASEPNAFAKLVLERAFQPLPARQATARMRLADETWSEKALRFERWLGRSDP